MKRYWDRERESQGKVVLDEKRKFECWAKTICARRGLVSSAHGYLNDALEVGSVDCLKLNGG